MVDPTGISQTVIAKLVDAGLNELKAIYECKDKCGALDNYLRKIRPMVSTVAASLPKHGSPQATGTAVAGLGIVKEWLDNLTAVLDKANSEVWKCKEIRRWEMLKLLQISKRVSAITKEIQHFFTYQSFLPLLVLGVQTNQTADEINQKVIEISSNQKEAKKVLDDLRIRHKLNTLNLQLQAEEFIPDVLLAFPSNDPTLGQNVYSGSFWFRAQVYNRETNGARYSLSCYNADVRYDHLSNSFRARYPPQGVVEDRVPWSRLRAPPVGTSTNDLYFSDRLEELRPGDHVEVQWRKRKDIQLHYGWFYGTVGHVEGCSRDIQRCQCSRDDTVWLLFNQYPVWSHWRKVALDRKSRIEQDKGPQGFYGGIRKLQTDVEVTIWLQFLQSELSK